MSGVLQVRWNCHFAVTSTNKKLKYYLEIYRISSLLDITRFNDYIKVFESSSTTDNDHFDNKLYIVNYDMTVLPGHTYRATLHYKIGSAGLWHTIESNTWNTYSACAPNANFNINGNTSINITTPLSGQISMNCPNAINCSETHFIAVQECNANGNVFGVEKVFSPSSAATFFDLKSQYNFQKYKYYRIKLAVSEPWTERTVILYIN